MFDDLISELNSTVNLEDRVVVLQDLQELEYEMLYKYPIFTIGHMVYLDSNLVVPSDVVFGDSKYKYDIQIEDWKVTTSN